MTNPRLPKPPQHLNTDSEQTGVIPPVQIDPVQLVQLDSVQPAYPAPDTYGTKRKPLELVGFLALVVLLGGMNWAVWLAFPSDATRVLVGTVSVTALLLASSNGVKLRGGAK